MRGYLARLSLFLILVTIGVGVILYDNYNILIETTRERLEESLYTADHLSLITMCNVVGCDGAMVYGELWVKDHYSNTLTPYDGTDLPDSLSWLNAWSTTTFCPSDRTNVHLLVKNTDRLTAMYNLYIWLLLGSGVLYTMYYRNVITVGRTNSRLTHLSDKFKLEGKLQHTIAESAYHEMMSPVASIRTAMGEIEKALDTTEVTCGVTTCPDVIPSHTFKKYASVVNDSILRLESVLELMSDSKESKYTRSVRSLHSLVESSTKSQQIYHTSTNFEFIIDGSDLLKEYGVNKLTNGTTLNILNNMIKNSLEAGATTIVFGVKKKLGSDTLNLFITDNGGGVPGINNVKDYPNVFDLGYTSKANKASVEVTDSPMLSNFVTYFNPVKGLANDDFLPNSTRGVGLFLTKEILTKAKGGITMVETGVSGTVFKLTFCVTKLDDTTV